MFRVVLAFVVSCALWPCVALAQEGSLAILAPPADAPRGATVGPLRVQRRTSLGEPLAGAGDLLVSVVSDSTTGEVSRGVNGPWASTVTVTIVAGTSEAELFFRDLQPHPVRLTASATGWRPGVIDLTTSALLLSEDFERAGGLLLTDSPPGPWTFVNNPAGLTLGPDSAHRGSAGLRVTADTTAEHADPSLRNGFASRTGDLHLRFWTRFVSAVELGNVVFGNIGWGPFAELRAYSPSLRTTVAGLNGIDTQSDPAMVFLTPGRWHLIEVSVFGARSGSGARRVWVDGSLGSEATGIDLAVGDLRSVAIGSIRGSGAPWTGTIDYDDVRASDVPHACRLTLPGSELAHEGACAPVRVALTDCQTGAPAAAPYDVTVALEGDELAQWHLSPDCAAPASTVTLPAGTTEVTGYVQVVAPGPFVLRASHPDFLGADTGGTKVTTSVRLLASGCDATATVSNRGGLLALLLWLLSRASSLRRFHVRPGRRRSSLNERSAGTR